MHARQRCGSTNLKRRQHQVRTQACSRRRQVLLAIGKRTVNGGLVAEQQWTNKGRVHVQRALAGTRVSTSRITRASRHAHL